MLILTYEVQQCVLAMNSPSVYLASVTPSVNMITKSSK